MTKYSLIITKALSNRQYYNCITMKLHNITLTPEYNSNLILLDQPQESGIICYNNPKTMTLLRSNRTITHIKGNHNLFTLNLAILY